MSIVTNMELFTLKRLLPLLTFLTCAAGNNAKNERDALKALKAIVDAHESSKTLLLMSKWWLTEPDLSAFEEENHFMKNKKNYFTFN